MILRQNVGGSAGRERHDDANRVIGIIRRRIGRIGALGPITGEDNTQPENDQPAR